MGLTRPLPLLRALAGAAAAVLTATALVTIGAQSASADPLTLSPQALPTVQVNGVVWTQVVVGNTVYAGGDFTTASPISGGSVTRTDILAYNLTTGELIGGFAPTFNGQVRGLAASADGSQIYAVGSFTAVNGQGHARIVALDAASGAPIAGFGASLNSAGYAVTVSGGNVYAGGDFTSADGATRTRAAGFTSSGALTAFNPTVADYTVRGIAVSFDSSTVLLAGGFDSVNGAAVYGLAAVTSASGSSVPWAASGTVRSSGSNAAFYSLTSDGNYVYATSYDFGAPIQEANLEGAVSMSWNGGTINWIEDCHGDTYSSSVMNGILYTASHAHFCGNVPGGFQETDPVTYHRALAFSVQATGTLATNTEHSPGTYGDFGGQPSPTLENWYPDFTAGTYTGEDQASWSVASGSNYVVYGGEFTKVNGVAQTGLTRFYEPASSPAPASPVAPAPTPTPTSTATDPATGSTTDPTTGTTTDPTTDPTSGTATGTGGSTSAKAPSTPRTPNIKAQTVSHVRVSWWAPASNGAKITSYSVELKAASGTWHKTVKVSASTRSHIFTGLTAHKAYTATVVAKNSVGSSKSSHKSKVATTKDSHKKANTVAKPKVVTTATAITITWVSPSTAGRRDLTDYRVKLYRGSTLVKTVTLTSTHHSLTVKSLRASTKYSATVTASDHWGWGHASAKTSKVTAQKK